MKSGVLQSLKKNVEVMGKKKKSDWMTDEILNKTEERRPYKHNQKYKQQDLRRWGKTVRTPRNGIMTKSVLKCETKHLEKSNQLLLLHQKKKNHRSQI